MKNFKKVNFTKGLEYVGEVSKNRKENLLSKGFKILDSRFKELLDVRFYYTNNRVYCVFWLFIKDKGIGISGGAFAKGSGYDKVSQSLENAFKDAGIELIGSKNKLYHFGGNGLHKEISLELCKKLTKRKVHLVEFYG